MRSISFTLKEARTLLGAISEHQGNDLDFQDAAALQRADDKIRAAIAADMRIIYREIASGKEP